MKITYVSIPSTYINFHTVIEQKPCSSVELYMPKDYFPSVFPLGGANGEGKSTVLQFVYALLTQWNSMDKALVIEFISAYIDIQESDRPQTIATINTWDGNKEHVLDFQVLYMDGIISLMPINYKLPLNVYLITHSCESHKFLIKGNHFFYYEDVFHRVSSINSLGERKYSSLVDWVSKEPNKNAVILLDNVDAFLHPDWQYNIVKDLKNSGVSQFIMATHSYDLCEALTPSQMLTLGN